MRKCPQCHRMIADEKVGVCPSCGTELEIVFETPAPAEKKTEIHIVSQQKNLGQNAANQYGLLAVGLSLVAFLLSLYPEGWILWGVGTILLLSWIPLGASRRYNHFEKGKWISFYAFILQILAMLIQMGTVALISWNFLKGGF